MSISPGLAENGFRGSRAHVCTLMARRPNNNGPAEGRQMIQGEREAVLSLVDLCLLIGARVCSAEWPPDACMRWQNSSSGLCCFSSGAALVGSRICKLVMILCQEGTRPRVRVHVSIPYVDGSGSRAGRHVSSIHGTQEDAGFPSLGRC